jgi:predicted porin
MDKSTDFYVVMDNVKLSDGYKDKGANGFASQNTYGIGMRLKF